MAKHSYEKARWNRREARKRMRIGKWPFSVSWYTNEFRDFPKRFFAEDAQMDFSQPAWVLFRFLSSECQYQMTLEANQVRLNSSVHACLSEATYTYRKLWRYQGHQQERLHLLELHDEAQELDPQPRRLGVMRDIW